MQKFKWIFGLILIMTTAMSFQAPVKETINWITFAELNTLYQKEPRPILVDVYTGWCGWCKQMDKTTYKNEKLAKYVNEKYYAVKFDAESKDTITFNNKKFTYDPAIKTNGLALYLTFDRLEYPTTIFLSAINARPAPLSGYMKPKEMEAPLKFFGEKADASTTFVEFNKKLKSEW